MPTNGDLSLYIHVPFCEKKCDYCHFFVVPNREALKNDWFSSLKKEWELIQPYLKDYSILTLYFGGGTPSLIAPDWIEEIISWVKVISTPKEITLEINPEDSSPEKLKAFFDAGINRLSIGIQTFDDDQLITLGRQHSGNKAKKCIQDAYTVGFRNISCDLMYDLPNQTLNDWERTLDQMVKMPITHLSLYNLTIEPNTAFFKQRKRLQPLLPEDEVSKEMFLMAIDKMTSNGFDHYEISAFCKDNLYSLHNIGYWLGRTFLGLGPSAFSYHQGKRFQNVSSISQYKSMLKNGSLAHSFTEELEPEHKIRELFTIQLRLRAGIPIVAFESNFGVIPLEIKEALLDFENLGWIVNSSFHPQLTQEGILFYDTIAERLI